VDRMNLYTIGFTKKPAERFFALLREHGVERLVDIRLHPGGQLAGFTKQSDFPYFLTHLADCEYHHFPTLAPSDDVLSGYRKDHDWSRYVTGFEALMEERKIPSSLNPRFFAEKACCLLCSEATPEQCHRRLVAERLARAWPDTTIIHIL
jgi:uncharacterized protein (DUF488 family)